jgi:hypothetical protein
VFVAMSTIGDVGYLQQICKPSYKIINKILKEVLHASNSLPCQFVGIDPSFSSFGVNDLLWFVKGLKLLHFVLVLMNLLLILMLIIEFLILQSSILLN